MAASRVEESVVSNENEVLNHAGVGADSPPYTYHQLLERAVGYLQQNNPDYAETRRHTVKPPRLARRKLWAKYSLHVN